MAESIIAARSPEFLPAGGLSLASVFGWPPAVPHRSGFKRHAQQFLLGLVITQLVLQG